MSSSRQLSQLGHEACARLHEQFPACFVDLRDRQAVPRPLMIGIHDAITRACPDLSRRVLQRVFGIYTARSGYAQAVVLGAARIDLEGREVGVVTETEASATAEQFRVQQELSRARTAARRAEKARQRQIKRAKGIAEARARKLEAREAEQLAAAIAASEPASLSETPSAPPRRPIISLKRAAPAADLRPPCAAVPISPAGHPAMRPIRSARGRPQDPTPTARPPRRSEPARHPEAAPENPRVLPAADHPEGYARPRAIARRRSQT